MDLDTVNTISDAVRKQFSCFKCHERYQVIRDYLSVKKSKKATLKQIVPDYNRLKNFYTLLWDMPDNDGYINIVAIMQKYFDQAISGNWSYNPENYEGNEVTTICYGKRPTEYI